MAERQPTIELHVNLGNATQEIDRFGYALSRVDQKARGIYATLRELSERYQEHGFLGQADQRALERGMQSWQRMGELLDLQRRGATARLQEARFRATGDPAEDPRVLAAERALYRLQGQKLGRGILQEGLSQGILAGLAPGPLPPLPNRPPPSFLQSVAEAYAPIRYPPTAAQRAQEAAQAASLIGNYGMGRSALASLGAAYAPIHYPPTAAQRAQEAAQSASLIGNYGMGQSALGAIGAAYRPIHYHATAAQQATWTAQGASLIGNYGMGRDALGAIGAAYAPIHYPATAAQLAEWTAQGAGLIGNYGMGRPPAPVTYGGPYTPWGPGMVGGPGGHMAAAWMGSGWRGSGGMGGGIEAGVGAVAPWLARGAGMVAGLGAAGVGYSAYKLLSEGMQAYETRAMGVIKLGGQMNQEYGDLDETIKGVRAEFNMLAKDSVDMMGVMVRSTGQAERGTVRRLAGFALAHGMSGAEVATNYGTLARYGADRTPNMAVIEAMRREGVAAGGSVLPTADFQSAVARMATVGGTALLPMGEVERTRYATMMGLFGQKYGADPAQAFAEFAAGAGGPKSTMGEVVLGLGLEDIRRRNPILNIGDPNKGGMRLNLNNYNDWLIAKEQAGISPEIQEAVYGRAAGMAGNNRQLQEALFGGGMGITTATGTRQILLGFEEARRQGGGTVQDYVQRPVSPVATDEAEKARLDVLKGNKELWDTLRLAVQGEVLSEEGLVPMLRKLRLELGDTVTSLTRMKDPIDGVTRAWQGLSSDTMTLVGLGLIGLGMFPSPASGPLVGTGLGLTGAGTVKALNEHGTEEERKRQQQTGPRKPAP
jgi:hypothetical protein